MRTLLKKLGESWGAVYATIIIVVTMVVQTTHRPRLVHLVVLTVTIGWAMLYCNLLRNQKKYGKAVVLLLGSAGLSVLLALVVLTIKNPLGMALIILALVVLGGTLFLKLRSRKAMQQRIL